MFSISNKMQCRGASINVPPAKSIPIYSYSSPTGSDSFSGYSTSTNVLGFLSTGSSDIYSGSSEWYSPMGVMYFGNHYGVDTFSRYPTGSISILSDITQWSIGGEVLSSGYNQVMPSIFGFSSETLRSSSSLSVCGFVVKKYSSSFSA